MMRKDLTASHRVSVTAGDHQRYPSARRAPRASRILHPATAMGPVSRTRTPWSGVRFRSRAALRISSLAAAPGDKRLEIERGLNLDETPRPMRSLRPAHKRLPGKKRLLAVRDCRPACRQSLSSAGRSGRGSPVRAPRPARRSRDCPSRRAGSDRRPGRRGTVAPKSAGASSISLRLRAGTAIRSSGRTPRRRTRARTERFFFWPLRLSASNACPRCASSGVAPSMTTRMRLSCCGNSAS